MYNQSNEQVKNILDVWKVIELATPPKNETLNSYFTYAQKHAATTKEFYKEISKKDALFLLQDAPFEKFNKEALKATTPGYDVFVHWHLYLGYLNWTEAEIAIEAKINELFNVEPQLLDSYKNRKNPVLTPIVALTLDEDMNLIDNSMVISTGAYVLGKIVQEGFSEADFKDLVEFEDNSAALIVNALKYSFDQTNQQTKFTLDRVNYITKFITNKLGIDSKFLLSNPEICVRKTAYKKLKEDDKKNTADQKEIHDTPEKQIKRELDWAPPPVLEMFNSFFLKPLDLVRNNIDKFTPNSPISKYLGVEDKPNFKDVLNNPQFLEELLELSRMQVARWPSSPTNCLAALQTAAINNIIQKTENTEHIFAINGPPGTGKTTLLFDIIANIYVQRAFNLAKFNTPDKGFNGDKYLFKIMGIEYEVAAIDSSIQNYEIVVASSNNSAVENISKELPLYEKIDKIYHEEIKFFDWLANDDNNKKNWGIFTAVLGNKTNRQAFLNKFWKPEFRNLQATESYKYKTMFQYLNLLKGLPEAHVLKHLKPDYCSSPTLIKETWQKACNDFNQLYQEILDINEAITKVISLNQQKNTLLGSYQNKDLLKVLEERTEQIISLESTLQYIDSKIEELNYERKLISLGLFAKIHTFFKTKKYNNFIQDNLRLTRAKSEQLDLAQKTKADIQLLRDKSKKLKLDIEQFVQIENFLSHYTEFLGARKFDVTTFKDADFWQNYSNNYDEFHKTTPYFNQEVEKLRSKLFIQAIKLHEIFINANAINFWNSLKLFSEIMNGKINNIEPEIWRILWQNFFMIIPVVSTTFHSFDNMFKHFRHNDLAWLIIDEAGQTPPQCAVSAIYKSKNVIVVGDPMQTSPISILGQELIKKLCQKLKVEYSTWSPSEVSVQHLADRNSSYQTQYGNISVGFPLLVHRRCQNPMFDICNSIAYKNQMIFAATSSESLLSKSLGNSRWINVEDKHVQKKRYESDAEIAALFDLLKLISDTKLLEQIYIITMYKNYSSYIQYRLKQDAYKLNIKNHVDVFCTNNIGTIHAFQGKENDTVIIMLGAQHPDDKKARSFMTSKPNVLNVGVSRAKNNLYIIGNAKIWFKHKYMQELYNMLS